MKPREVFSLGLNLGCGFHPSKDKGRKEDPTEAQGDGKEAA